MIMNEEGRVIEIDEWKRMIEKYLPTYFPIENVKCSFYMGFTSGSTGSEGFYVRNNRGS